METMMTRLNYIGLTGQIICTLLMFICPVVGFQTDKKIFYFIALISGILFFLSSVIAIN